MVRRAGSLVLCTFLGSSRTDDNEAAFLPSSSAPSGAGLSFPPGKIWHVGSLCLSTMSRDEMTRANDLSPAIFLVILIYSLFIFYFTARAGLLKLFSLRSDVSGRKIVLHVPREGHTLRGKKGPLYYVAKILFHSDVVYSQNN